MLRIKAELSLTWLDDRMVLIFPNFMVHYDLEIFMRVGGQDKEK